MSKKPGWSTDDKFIPVHSSEVSDLGTLPGEFRAFRAEMRSAIELLTQQLLPAVNRINEALDDVRIRLNRLERDRDDLKHAVAELERQTKQKRKGRK